MGWRRVDDQFDVHRKVLALRELGRARCASAIALWTLAGCHASRSSDGIVDMNYIRTTPIPRSKQASIDLISVGLWEQIDHGFRFHDDADYNPSPEEKAHKRRANADRQQKWRNARNASVTTLRNDPVTVLPSPPRSPSPSPPLETPCSPPKGDDSRPFVDAVFDHWVEHHWSGKGQRPKLDDKRRKLIKSRLKDCGHQQCILAIRGIKRSSHHMGHNDRAERYTGLHVVLRDAAQVEKFAALEVEERALVRPKTSGPAPPAPHSSFRNDTPEDLFGNQEDPT